MKNKLTYKYKIEGDGKFGDSATFNIPKIERNWVTLVLSTDDPEKVSNAIFKLKDVHIDDFAMFTPASWNDNVMSYVKYVKNKVRRFLDKI